MKAWLTPRRLVIVATLTATWCGLWRDVSVANILAGALLTIAIIASGLGTTGRGGIRLIPLLKFTWLVLVDLTRSTSKVALDTITPDSTKESIVAIEVGKAARHHHLLMIVAITISPGTAVVDADPQSGTLYVHILYRRWTESTIEHIQKLAQLAVEALPVDSDSSEGQDMIGGVK